ncbi:suppressor of los1-1 [Tulasnella sp. 427]|nr:suppressor of los1-1 [Tulasnella sp. 427]
MSSLLSVCTLLTLPAIAAGFPSPLIRPQTNQAVPGPAALSVPPSPTQVSSPAQIRSQREVSLHDHPLSDLFSDFPPSGRLDGEYTLRLHWHELVQFLSSPSRSSSPPQSPPDEVHEQEVNVVLSGAAPPFPPRRPQGHSGKHRAHHFPSNRPQNPQLVISNEWLGSQNPPVAHSRHPAGSIYEPGTYPTPDLLPSPISKFAILSEPATYISEEIQQALDLLGPRSTLYLPPRTRWTVNATIHLHPHQEIATLGYPDDEEEIAWLEADESCTGHLLSAANTPGARIRNVGFDGGMEKFGPSRSSLAIVHLGHAQGVNQVIDRCTIRHPRGWSSLQVYDGAENVRVTNNRVGPAGYDETVMGRGHWADGISYAGQNGLVAGNIVTDSTDGAIVLFGAPGTLVTSNTVIVRTRMNSGAINMVDHLPYHGNYNGTTVIHNTVRMEGSYLNIAFAQGPSTWWLPKSNQPQAYNRGAVVRLNLLTAAPNTTSAVGYGYAVSDVQEWTCTDNEVSPNVVFKGDLARLSHEPRVASLPPGPFVRSPSRADSGPKQSVLQEEFVEGPVRRLLAIRPGEPSYRTFLPGQLTLALGESLTLKRVKLSFDHDGELRLSSHGDAGEALLWEAGCRNRVGLRQDSKLVFDARGNLGIVSADGHTLCSLTPQLEQGVPDLLLEVSSERPHLFLASSTSGSVYWSPMGYEVGHQWEIREGAFVSLMNPRSRTVFLSGINPLGQFVVLRSVGTAVVPATLPWPVSSDKWLVEWKSHEVEEGKLDPGSYIFFQDDGNLVTYSGTTNAATWATATDDRSSLVTGLRWTLDSNSGLVIACTSRDDSVAWSKMLNAVPSQPILYSFPDADSLVKDLASFILKAQFEAIDKRGRFTLALSGGSLPKMLNGLIGNEQVEWEKWHIFFADERVVRLDHPDSNYKLCHDELFSKIPQIPKKNIHAINVKHIVHKGLHDKKSEISQDGSLKSPKHGKATPEEIDAFLDTLSDDLLEEVSEDYEEQLIQEFAMKDSARFPVFDLIMLGMGPDGHTASLFPGHPLLSEEERWVAWIADSPKPPPKRITFTYSVINHAAKVAFVASGAGKQDMLQAILDRPEEGLPSSRVKPKSPGAVYWFVDDAAAAKTQYGKTQFKL